jgi:hypothetical protein
MDATTSLIKSLRAEARELRRMARNTDDARYAERCKSAARVKTQIANRKAKEVR